MRQPVRSACCAAPRSQSRPPTTCVAATSAANLERRAWTHPFTGEVRTDSFADLFDEARLVYPTIAEAFVRGDEARLRELVDGLDFAGRPAADE